jgi:transcriptional regulator with XRE-family HTH domain
MKDRLQQFLTLEQLSPARLSEIIGIQRSGLSHILSGRNKPGFDFINKLLIKFPSINAEWLITGKGKMYKELPSSITDKKNDSDINKISNQAIQFPDKLQFGEENRKSEPSEISIKENLPEDDSKKRTLKKMIFVYSDGTFVEYSPTKD